MNEPGVYRSDVDGHLFVLKFPISVTCVICMETCRREDYKTNLLFKAAAIEFVNKHGALDERIADNLAQIIPPRSVK
jgi:hypothetical protein